jgi:hypothetical protein
MDLKMFLLAMVFIPPLKKLGDKIEKTSAREQLRITGVFPTPRGAQVDVVHSAFTRKSKKCSDKCR